MTDKRKYLVYIIIPLIILLVLASFPFLINIFGKSFSLKGVISGDYENSQNTVNINYDISEAPNTYFKDEQQIDSYMYICLEDKNGFYVIKDIKAAKPSTGIYLRGKVNYYRLESNLKSADDKILIYYDIQQYFLSKNDKGIKNGDKVKVNLKFLFGKTIVQGIEKIY